MNYLLLVFALSGSVWAALLLPRAPLVLLCTALLVIGTVFGPAFFAIDGPLQISADRVLFAGLCLLGCVRLARGGATLPKLVRCDYLVAGVTLWFLISALSGGEPVRGVNPLGTWLFYILVPACIYALVRISPPSPGDLQIMISALIGLGLYLAVTGICETRGWHSLVFPKFVADPKQWEFFGRARGPLLNPSANGVLLTFALGLAALRAYHGGRAAKIGYGVIVLIIAAGVYSTLTRSVWIGGVLSLAVIFWSQMPRWTKVLGLASVVLVGAMVTIGLNEQLLRMKRDRDLSAAEAEKSVRLRPLLAIIAYEMFKDAPLVGHGFGNYARNSQPYFSDRSYDLPLEQARGYFQHNVLLSVAADTGLIGLVLFGALLALWTRSAWRLGQTRGADILPALVGLGCLGGIVAYGTAGMFQDVLVMPMIQMYLCFIGALVVTLSDRGQDQGRTAAAIDCRLSGAPLAAGMPVGDGAYQPVT